MNTCFHVDPAGGVAGDGSRSKPFATLERARDAVRALKRSAGGLPKGGVTVWLGGGVYVRERTLELGPEDSGAPEAPVVYRALDPGRPRLLGGRVPRDFTPVRDPAVLARLEPAARPHVCQCDLRALGMTDLGRKGKGFSGTCTIRRSGNLFQTRMELPAVRFLTMRFS